jgi:hypothetical protein
MAKRSVARAADVETRRAARAEGQKPKGTSKYAIKHARQARGNYKPPVVRQRAPWFVRWGWLRFTEPEPKKEAA